LNISGHHISTIGKIKIVSNISPWFSNRNVGDIERLPLSTKEGRVVGDMETIEKLIEKGQIGSQYIDFNPTDSIAGIESMTSPDGRVLGRTASSDRLNKGLYKNVDIDQEEKLFKAGINYFR